MRREIATPGIAPGPDAETEADEQLLAAFVSGERSALGELAERYERPLLGLAAGFLGGGRSPALDAVQETWLRVIRHGASFNGSASFKTWVYRIAINCCRDAGAKANRTTPAGNGATPGITDLHRDQHDAAPDSGAVREETSRGLRDAIEQLTAPKREVILLCYHDTVTHQQAAQILEIPVGTLKSRLNAALTELRAMMSECAETSSPSHEGGG